MSYDFFYFIPVPTVSAVLTTPELTVSAVDTIPVVTVPAVETIPRFIQIYR